MDDAEAVEVADASNNAKQAVLRNARQHAFMPHARVANPKRLPEGCFASLHGNIQILPVREGARPHAVHFDEVRMRERLEQPKASSLFPPRIELAWLPLDDDCFLREFIKSHEYFPVSAACDPRPVLFAKSGKASVTLPKLFGHLMYKSRGTLHGN